MPRYDDRNWNTRVYVGRLSSRTRSRDLHDLFSRYGRVRAVDMKHDFAFVEFSDPRDADDACYRLNGRNFDGSRIIVEFAKGGPRGSGSREYLGRGPPPGSGRCFNCGIDGHWARDCKAGDWKNKCYRCGERGHIERNCPNSPRSFRRGRTYSRSLSRSPSPRRGRSLSRSFSRSRSYSRSRSPGPRRERSIERDGKRSRSLSYSRSPEARSSPRPRGRGRERSLSPNGSMSPRERSSSPSRGGKRSPYPNVSMSPREERDDGSPPKELNGSDYGQSPRMENGSRSPMSQGECPPDLQRRSPEMNGRDGRDESPGEGDLDVGASPRVGELPTDRA